MYYLSLLKARSFSYVGAIALLYGIAMFTHRLSATTLIWADKEVEWSTDSSKWNNTTPDNAVFSGNKPVTVSGNIITGFIAFTRDATLRGSANATLTFKSFETNDRSVSIRGELMLHANAENSVASDSLHFYETSGLSANVPHAIAGGTQYFTDTSALNVNTGNAVVGGTQVFHKSSSLNANASGALSEGHQQFYDASSLKANVKNSVDTEMIELHEQSSLEIRANDATASTAMLTFYDSGKLRLNGHNTKLGAIYSASPGAGIIENDATAPGALTVVSEMDSMFSGTIRDGEGGAPLALVKDGPRHLILTGNNIYTGDTDVLDGTLLANNTSGSATGYGNVNVGENGILGGNGTIAGNTRVSGKLMLGDDYKPLRIQGDLTLEPGSITIMQIKKLNPSYGNNRVIVDGFFTMGGTLKINLVDYVPAKFDSFDFFDFGSGNQSDAFSSLSLPSLSDGLSWDDSLLSTQGVLFVVPEPSTGILILVSIACAGLLIFRQRGQKQYSC